MQSGCKMKIKLVLEYRIRKLERLLFEDAIDDELDSMSDEILKNNPYVDVDDEVDKKAKDIIDKEPGYFYHADEYGNNPKTFNTIDEYLDNRVMDVALNPELTYDGDTVKLLTSMLNSATQLTHGLDYVRHIKKIVKEISSMNVLVAQQKLATALRKHIKEERKKAEELLNKHKEQFNHFAEDLKSYLENEIKRCVGRKAYYITYAISQKDDFSVDFVVRDKYYKDRTISFNVTECKHIAWNRDHFYNVTMKRIWPSENLKLNNKELTIKEVKKYTSSKVCWKLNGYEFDEGKFYE